MTAPALRPEQYLAECPCGCSQDVVWTARAWSTNGTGHNYSVVDVADCAHADAEAEAGEDA